MISVMGVTKNYVLQPVLLQKHASAIQWLSTTMLWKGELIFFQKLLDENASRFLSIEDKKKIDHFQNLIIYYKGEVVDQLRSKLRQHESKLASILETKNETNTSYFNEHDTLMEELETFESSFAKLKQEFFQFMERK